MADPDYEIRMRVQGAQEAASAVDKVGGAVKGIDDAVAKAAKALEDFESSSGSLEDKKKLGKALSDLIKEIEGLGDSSEVTADGLQSLQAALNGVTDEIADLEEAELAKVTEAQAEAFEDAARAARLAEDAYADAYIAQGKFLDQKDGVSDLGKVIGQAGDTAEGAGGQVDDLGEKSERTGRSFEKLGNRIGGVIGTMVSMSSWTDVAAGALLGLLALYNKWQEGLQRVRDRAAELGPEIVRTHKDAAVAVSELRTQTEATGKALGEYLDANRANEGFLKKQGEDALSLARALFEVERATLALKVARGEISDEDAARKQFEEEERIARLEQDTLEREATVAADAARRRAGTTEVTARQAEIDAARAEAARAGFSGLGGDAEKAGRIDELLNANVRELQKVATALQGVIDEGAGPGGAMRSVGNVEQDVSGVVSPFPLMNLINLGRNVSDALNAMGENSLDVSQAEAELKVVSDALATAQQDRVERIESAAADLEREAEEARRLADERRKLADAMAKESEAAEARAADVTGQGREVFELQRRAAELNLETAQANAARVNDGRGGGGDGSRGGPDLKGALETVTGAIKGSNESDLVQVVSTLKGAAEGAVSASASQRSEIDKLKAEAALLLSRVRNLEGQATNRSDR